jgi:phage virion morphogenesis protein
MADELGLVFKVEGEKDVLNKLGKMSKRIINRKALHLLWGKFLTRWVQKNFETEGQLTGKKWKKLSAQTLLQRRRGSSKILNDTGTHLKNTFSAQADNRKVQVGTPTEFAPIHQFGLTIKAHTIKPKKGKALRFPLVGGGFVFTKKANIPAIKMPARPMLPPEFKLISKDILTIAEQYVNGQPIKPKIGPRI